MHVDGVGLANITSRAAGQEAHEDTFDKLLADYFMQSRKQHKKGNQLLAQMEELFSGFTEDADGVIGMKQNRELDL